MNNVLLYTPPMNTNRQKNLRALIEQWGGGDGLAKKLGHSNSSYLSQMVNGHRPITEKTARGIEDKLRLSAGWMDVVHDDFTDTSIKRVAVDTQLFAQVVAITSAAMEEMGFALGVEKFEDVVTFIYEDAVQNGSVNSDLVVRALKLAR